MDTAPLKIWLDPRPDYEIVVGPGAESQKAHLLRGGKRTEIPIRFARAAGEKGAGS